MMVIYLPVKFEFDYTNRFRVRVRKQKMWTDVGHINIIGGLVTRNPPKNCPNYILHVLYIFLCKFYIFHAQYLLYWQVL